MNETEMLLKKLRELLGLFGRWIRGAIERFIFKFQTVSPAKRIRIWIACGVSVLFFGNFLLSAISRGKLKVPGFLGPFGVEAILSHPLRGHLFDADGNLVLCDFEKKEDLSLWDKNNASIRIAQDHTAHGKQSASVIMEGGKGMSGISMEEFFSNAEASNWLNYDSLHFHIFNPGKTTERFLIQVKDQWNRRYKSDFLVEAGKGEDVSIPVRTIAASINVRKVDQVTLFRWTPRETREIFIDYLRLEPLNAPNKIRSAAAQNQKTQEIKKTGLNPVDFGFAAKKKAWLIQVSESEGEVVRIPFVVANETEAPCIHCPVEGSVPFPMGELRETGHARLRNAQNVEIPMQPRALARWPDGSIKWMALNFMASAMPLEGMGFYIDYGQSVRPLYPTSVPEVRDTGRDLEVQNGKLKVLFSKRNFFLFDEVWLDQNANGNFEPEEKKVEKAELFLKAGGKEFLAEEDTKNYHIEVEEKGPVRVVIKATGGFQSPDKQRTGELVIRYYIYQNESSIRISHTFIYTGYPENKVYSKFKDLPLPGNETLSELGMRLHFSFNDPMQTTISMGAQPPEILDLTESSKIDLVQTGWKEAKIINDAENIPPGDFYSGWMDMSDPQNGLTVALRDFRENFPKAIRADRAHGIVEIDLWPKEAGEMDLATRAQTLDPGTSAAGSAFGLGKTHEILFYFHDKNAVAARAPEQAYSYMQRIVLRNNPYWVEATGVLGRLFPVSERYVPYEKMLDRLFDWAARQPKVFAWYGFFNFGDTLRWYRAKDKHAVYPRPGWNPSGPWGWMAGEGAGLVRGSFLQFLRSGQWKYFEFGENSARHLMDIATIHYEKIPNDGNLKKILDWKLSQKGAVHGPGSQPWSGRADTSAFTDASGLALYYYLTGNERARDVLWEMGDFVSKEPFAPYDNPDQTSHRALGNALATNLTLFEMSGEERFKKAADAIVQIYAKGQQPDGSFLRNYNPRGQSWSGPKRRIAVERYVLGPMIQYHQMTQDEKAKKIILRAVGFLADKPSRAARSLHGVAYAYWLTHDKKYLALGEKGLQYLVRNQRTTRDSILDGMLFDRPSYDRVRHYLATVPYIFSALEEGFAEAGADS